MKTPFFCLMLIAVVTITQLAQDVTPSPFPVSTPMPPPAPAATPDPNQVLVDRVQQINWLFQNNQREKADQVLRDFVATYKTNEFANAMAADLYMNSVGDYVAAIHHLEAALALASDAITKQRYTLKIADVKMRRDILLDALIKQTDAILATDVPNPGQIGLILKDSDKLTIDNPKILFLKGSVAGIYRRFEDAVKIFNVVLDLPNLDDPMREKVIGLRDYCLAKVTSDDTLAKVDHKTCPICGGPVLKKAAYCPVCLNFQYCLQQVKTKNARTDFTYSTNGILSYVQYKYQNKHSGFNFGMAMLGGLAGAAGALGGVTTPVITAQKDADTADRTFNFQYDGGILRGVDSNGQSYKGGTTYYSIDVMSGTSGKQDRTAGVTGSPDTVRPVFTYSNNPTIDPQFAFLCFGKNLYRGFSPNATFSPFVWWNEPRVFILNYDKDMRIINAVDQHSFAGTDILKAPTIFSMTYNADGLLSSIVETADGKEKYRRDILYTAEGISEERVIVQTSKKPKTETTRYKWQNGQLIGAEGDGFSASFVINAAQKKL